MLFTEAQLKSANPMAVLDEAVYLDESEALINPATVPVREMSRLGEGVTMVRFDDIAALAESHGADYIDAMVAVAEASGVDPEKMAIAVDEADIITNPDIVLELANVVVAPLSEDSLAMRYVCECIDQWSEMEDSEASDMALAEALIEDTYLQTFLEAGEGEKNAVQKAADSVKGFAKDTKNVAHGFKNIATMDFYKGDRLGAALQHAKKNKGETAALVGMGLAGTAGVIAGAKALLNKKDAPKSWLGQKVAALRKIYANWMQKAAKGGSGVAAKMKQAAGKLLQIIDALMAKIQNMAG